VAITTHILKPLHLEEYSVTETEMDPATNDILHEARLKRWVDSVGTVTLPLLAGFSITSVVVVSNDAANFRWPGAAILALAFAAFVLVVAVQCAYHAHVYFSKEDPDYRKGLCWAKLTRGCYDFGLLAVLVGLALVVVPHRTAGIQADFRWAAFSLACAACLGEVVWVLRDPWLRSAWGDQMILHDTAQPAQAARVDANDPPPAL
jgi:hypothetical protein